MARATRLPVVALALAIAAAVAPDARAETSIAALSDDGSVVIFSTTEPLVVADRDFFVDVYRRAGGVTTLLSAPGPTAPAADPMPADFVGATADGQRAFFLTYERLVAEDTDNGSDVYEHAAGATRLVSAAAPGASGLGPPNCAGFGGVSADGGTVFFSCGQRLVPQDVDDAADVYARRNGVTTLVSVDGPGGSGDFWDSTFAGSSADGNIAYFYSRSSHTADDTDGQSDIFKRADGITTLVSGDAFEPAFFQGMTSDGGTVFFHTEGDVDEGDQDGRFDVYASGPGGISLISSPGEGATGPAGDAVARGFSPDGTRAIFGSVERLVAADTDTLWDVYLREGGTTTLLSAPGTGASGPAFDVQLGGLLGTSGSVSSTDAGRVFFTTQERLVGADGDDRMDVYERSGGVTTLVSAPGAGATGPDADVSYWQEISADGAHALFLTPQRLVAADVDDRWDLYERADGVTRLVSVPGSGATGPAQDAEWGELSSDGTRAFVLTTERLTGADTDEAADIYERSGDTTTLVTVPQTDTPGGGGPGGDPGGSGPPGVPGPLPPPLPPGGTVDSPSASLPSGARPRVTARGRFRVRFSATPGASGTAAVRSAARIRVGSRKVRVRLGRRTFVVAPSGEVALRFTLSRANRKLLRERGRLRAMLKVRLSDATGLSSTATAPITLRR